MSFYNGTNKKNIYPTPVIGGVGLIKKLSNPINHILKNENNIILLIGKTFGHLEQSCFLKENYHFLLVCPPRLIYLMKKIMERVVLKLN